MWLQWPQRAPAVNETPSSIAQGTVGAKQVTECKGKKLNVAINGFGRIGALPRCVWPQTLPVVVCNVSGRAERALYTGRNFLRCVEGRDNSNLNIVVINDSGTLLPCSNALALKQPALDALDS